LDEQIPDEPLEECNPPAPNEQSTHIEFIFQDPFHTDLSCESLDDFNYWNIGSVNDWTEDRNDDSKYWIEVIVVGQCEDGSMHVSRYYNDDLNWIDKFTFRLENYEKGLRPGALDITVGIFTPCITDCRNASGNDVSPIFCDNFPDNVRHLFTNELGDRNFDASGSETILIEESGWRIAESECGC